MEGPISRSRFTSVAAAAAIVLVLGGLLAFRLMAREGGSDVQPPAAEVPAAKVIVTAGLEIPCWSCPNAREWSLRFRTDLDLLAPLGTGGGNAAEYFVSFEKDRGERYDEARAFQERRTEIPDRGDFGKVVPGDDPLLIEAEPWCDQATMRFYPDVLPVEGYLTRIPNLLIMLSMVRSWAARGVVAADPAEGLEDCRRAIRLGRLLRQDDVIIINDLVGLACIQSGALGMYEIAQRIGDVDLALLASVVLGEVAPQRLYTLQRVTAADLSPFVHRQEDGGWILDLPEKKMEALTEMTSGTEDFRFRGEAMLGAHVVAHLGTPDQQERMRTVLEDIVAAGDPIWAPFATWCRDTEPTEDLLRQVRIQL